MEKKMSEQRNTILLVDDEPRLLAALKRRLSMQFNVLTAEGGPEALNIINDNPDIAVIVADMQMPEMNGIELLKQVRVQSPEIRRIMLTGNSDENTAIAAVNEGQVMRFLRKPCETEVLKKAILHAVDDYKFAMWKSEEQMPAETDAGDNPAEAARDAFLSMINHELRTPLNHIIGLTKTLEDNPVNSDESYGFLSNIRESGEQLLILVNRILEYSRLRSEEVKPSDDELDVVACVQAELDLIRHKTKEKKLNVSIDSLRKKVDVAGHAGEIRLAIRELLNNAIKFNKYEGHISIMIKSMGGTVSVRVSDTGCGIPVEAIQDAQLPFRQVNSSFSREHDGVGIGLALVSTIARTNNGDLVVTSSEDAGTTAILTLRRAEIATGAVANVA